MARAFMKMSMALKSVSMTPRYFTTARVCYCNQLQEIDTGVKVKASNSRELFAALHTDINPASLLSVLEINKDITDGKHIVLALTLMHKYYQTNARSMQSLHNLHHDLHFKKMCSILHRNMRTFDIPQIIQSIKILSLLKVPASSVMVQSLLQLIRDSVNNLNLKEIFFLTHLLQVMESSHLSKAIFLALPDVFKAQYKLQIDKEDINELKEALRFASTHLQDPAVIHYLLKAIDNFEGCIDVDTALSILWSLCNIKNLSPNYLNILPRINTVIRENIRLMKPFDVVHTLLQLSLKISEGVDDFYDPLLITALIERIVNDDFDFNKAGQALLNINRMRFISLRLLNYLSSIASFDDKILSKCNPKFIIELVNSLADAHHKPPHWSRLSYLFTENYSRIIEPANLCQYALSLTSLDYFHPRIIEKVFLFDVNLGLLSDIHKKHFKKLYYIVKYFYPIYSGAWPSEKSIQTFNNFSISDYEKPKNYPLLSALEHVIGGSSFIKTNLETKEGFYIDHLLIFQDGNPVAYETTELTEDSNSTICVDNLNISKELKRVAVLLLPPEVYGRNVKLLNAEVSISIKILKAMSYEVIHIPLETWTAMPEYEKLPYLQNLIDTAKENCKCSK